MLSSHEPLPSTAARPVCLGTQWGRLERTHSMEIEAMIDLGMSERQVAAYYGVDVREIRRFRNEGDQQAIH